MNQSKGCGLNKLIAVILILSVILSSVPVLAETGEPALTLSETEVQVARGKSCKITASLANMKAKITWQSEDVEIATVNNSGVIVGKSVGTTTVKAYANGSDGNSVEKGVTVHVYEPVTKVAIREKKQQISLYPRQSIELHYDVEPKETEYNTVEWLSSDSSVAEVNAETGTVTAKKPGQVRIQAVSKEPVSKPKSDMVNIKVLTPVQNFNVSTRPYVMFVGQKQKVAVSGIVPSNASNKKMLFYSNNSSVASVDDKGNIIGEKMGVATITVSAADKQGAQNWFYIYVLNKTGAYPSISDQTKIIASLIQLDEAAKKQKSLSSNEQEEMEKTVSNCMALFLFNYLASETAATRKNSSINNIAINKNSLCYFASNQCWCCFPESNSTRYHIFGYLAAYDKNYAIMLTGFFHNEDDLEQFLKECGGASNLRMISVSGNAVASALQSTARLLN